MSSYPQAQRGQQALDPAPLSTCPAEHRLCCFFPFFSLKCQHFPFPWEPRLSRWRSGAFKDAGAGGAGVCLEACAGPGRAGRGIAPAFCLPDCPQQGRAPRRGASRGSCGKRRDREKRSEADGKYDGPDCKLSPKFPLTLRESAGSLLYGGKRGGYVSTVEKCLSDVETHFLRVKPTGAVGRNLPSLPGSKSGGSTRCRRRP